MFIRASPLTEPRVAKGVIDTPVADLDLLRWPPRFRSSFVISASAQSWPIAEPSPQELISSRILPWIFGPLNPLFPVSLQRPEHLGPRWMANQPQSSRLNLKTIESFAPGVNA